MKLQSENLACLGATAVGGPFPKSVVSSPKNQSRIAEEEELVPSSHKLPFTVPYAAINEPGQFPDLFSWHVTTTTALPTYNVDKTALKQLMVAQKIPRVCSIKKFHLSLSSLFSKRWKVKKHLFLTKPSNLKHSTLLGFYVAKKSSGSVHVATKCGFFKLSKSAVLWKL